MSKRSKIAFGILMLCFVFCLFMGLSGQNSLNKLLGLASGDEVVLSYCPVGRIRVTDINGRNYISFSSDKTEYWITLDENTSFVNINGVAGTKGTVNIYNSIGNALTKRVLVSPGESKSVSVTFGGSGCTKQRYTIHMKRKASLSSINVSGSDRVPVGSSITLRATASPSTSSLQGVTWTTQSTGGYGSVRISGSGGSATITGVATGTVKVCATSKGIVGCKTITVYNNVISNLTNGCSSPSKVSVGGQINLANCGKYTPYDRSVKFSCSVVSGSQYITISKDSNGCIVLGQANGTAKVRLREQYSNKTVDITVQVSGGSSGGGTTPPTTSETITCPSFSITSGQSKTFNASSSLGKRLTYSSSSSYLSISGNVVTADGYVPSSRTEYIYVTSSSGRSKSCPVTVRPASTGTSTPSEPSEPSTPSTPNEVEVNSKITLSKYSTTLVVGATESLGYSATPSGMGIRWKTTNPEVATVENGIIRAVGIGTANIIAYSAESDSVYAICYVSVVSNRVEVTGIQISPTTLNVVEGKTGYFNYALVPTSATDQGVYFKSADPTIATVNSAGLVTGVKEGRTTVTVSTKDGKKTSTGTVIVYPKESKIELKPITPPSGGNTTTNTTNNTTTNTTTHNTTTTHTTTVILPTGSDYKSYDNTLISLTVAGKNIYLGYYMPTVFVDNDVTEVKVEYIKSDKKSTVVVTGNKNLQVGNNIITVTVTAEVGDVNVYRVVVVRRGNNNTITSNILTENKEVRIITTEAPVIDMSTIEDVKDNNKTLIVLVQDSNGRNLYEWNVDGSYLTYVESGLDTYITYLTNIPNPLSETITDKDASYLGFRQRGVLPSVAIIHVYVGDKYEDGTVLNLYRYNDATSKAEYQYGNIKVSGGYIQLRIYDGAEYILTPNVIQTGGDMGIIYLGILLFIILIAATVYMIYKDHRRERW